MASDARVKPTAKTYLPQDCRTFKQLAGESGLSYTTVRSYVRLHRLPVVYGSRRLILVPHAAWQEFWAARQARWLESYSK